MASEYDMNKTEVDIMWERLKAAKARIAELEAERDRAIARHGDLIAVHMDVMNKLGNSTHELAECRAMNAALVAASASGQGVRMLPEWYVYDNTYQANNAALGLVHLNWSVASWQIRDDGSIAVMWQRPARPESEPFDALA
jgi:hypothetical protein